MRNKTFQKNNKKLKKLINTIINSFQAKLDWKRMRKREIKIIIPFRSYSTRNKKFQKGSKKKQKKKKIAIVASFQAIIGRKKMRNRENKNYRSVSFLPDTY